MITKEVIDQIYKKYNKKPKGDSQVDLGLLFRKTGLVHDILIDPETYELTISSIESDSPFHSIPVNNIIAIVPFEEWTAIVLHSSIIFLNNIKPITSIHLRPQQLSFWAKLTRHNAAI